MMHRKHKRALFLLLLPFAALAQAPAPAPTATVLARGVEYRHLQTQSPAGEPWSIHVLEVSRREKSIELRAVPGRGEDGTMQRELPTAMANRVAASGENVLAVVNGDYDLPAPHLGVSDGLSITSQKLWTTGKPAWPTMAVLRSREPVIAVADARIELFSGKYRWPLGAVNKPFGTAWGAGPRLYTREFGAAVRSESHFTAIVIGRLSPVLPLRADGEIRGVVLENWMDATDVAIPADSLVIAKRPDSGAIGFSTVPPIESLKPGDKVRLRTRTRIASKKGVQHAIGGFPILVEQGRRSIVGTPGENLKRRHPRTAICTNDRKIIFVVVDGRQPQLSVGMTLEELADLMVSLGCTTAMNTDGGGSSVMAITSSEVVGARHAVPLRIVNSPSDGQERGRGNAWVILRRK